MVSVIIPSYNRDIFVARAIYSVLLQDFEPLEIIVVDDGSTDYSHHVYKMFEGSIKVFYHEINQGASAARNTGIKNSKGEYIGFLDSDDYWLPNKLSLQMEYMLKHNSFVSQTQEYWIRHGKFVNPNKKNKKMGGNIFEISLKRSYISPSCVVIKRDVLEKIGYFRTDLKVAEDYELWLRLTSCYPIELIDRPLVVREMSHRMHLSSPQEGIEFWRIMGLVLFLRDSHLPQSLHTKALRELAFKCRVYGLGAGKRGKGITARLFLAMAERIKGHLGEDI